MRFKAIAVLGATAALLAGCSVTATWPTDATTQPTKQNATATVQPLDRESLTRIRVAAMGDMLPHGGVNVNVRNGRSYEYSRLFSKIKQIYANADIVYCNQESPSAPGMAISDYPRFNAPPDFATELQKAGCNSINLANNHTFDKNQDGVNQTRQLWESLNPLLLTGANRSAEEQRKVSYAEIDGVKVALLGYSMLSNMGRLTDYGLNHTDDEELVKAQIAEAKAEAQLVIVSMHWGEEYVQQANQTQRDYAKFLANQGVDVILGMHPHVLQQAEWLDRADGGRTLVWYSLGNLLSAQITLEQRTGGVALFDVLVDSSGNVAVVDPTFVPTYTWFPYRRGADGGYIAGRGFEIRPYWDAQELFNRAGYKTTIAEQYEHIRNVLGSDIKVYDGSN